MARVNPLIAFIGGMGSGYLTADKEREERERQAKMDQVVLDRADREKQDWQQKQDDRAKLDAVNAKVAGVSDTNYAVKHGLSVDDVRGMMGGSPNEGDDNYVSDEAAQHYIDNNIGAKQVNSNAASIAAQGVGVGLNGQQAVQGRDGQGVAVVDPSTATARPLYQKMEEKARILMDSEDPQQQQLGMAALAHAATQKSKDFNEGFAKAQATGDRTEVMKYLSGWGTEDGMLPYTDFRLEEPKGGYSPNGDKGVYQLHAKDKDGNEVNVATYDMSKAPKGVDIDGLLALHARQLSAPDKMFEYMRDDLTMRREDAKHEDDMAAKSADREITKQHYADTKAHQDALLEETKNQHKVENTNAAARLGLEKDRLSQAGDKPKNQKAFNDLVDDTTQKVADGINQTGFKVARTKTAVGTGMFDSSGKEIMKDEGSFEISPAMRKQVATMHSNGIEQDEIVKLMSDRDAKGYPKNLVYVKDPEKPDGSPIPAMKTSKGLLRLDR